MRLSIIEQPYLAQFTRSFVLHTSGGEVLIDTGLYMNAPEIYKSLEHPLAILASHGHWDHTGGHEWFRQKGVSLWASSGDSDILSDLQFQWKLLYEQFSGDFQIPQARRDIYRDAAGSNTSIDRVLSEGDRLDFGNVNISVLSTPGHSAGSLCYMIEEEGLLFTGDTVSGNGFFGVVPQIEDPSAFLETLERLRKTEVEAAHTGHWPEVLHNKAFHELLSDGIDCCSRLFDCTKTFLDNNPHGFTLGQAADYLCEKEGGKPKGSGACVTALAFLNEFKTTYETAAKCCERYTLQR